MDTTPFNLPAEGSLEPELQRLVHAAWAEEAPRCGVDLAGFDPDATPEACLEWARRRKLDVAFAYVRYSTDKQDSFADQLRPIAQHAARSRMYLSPHLSCGDRAIKGAKEERPGLDRAKLVLASGLVAVLLVFKLSRLYRLAFRSMAFLRQNVVERGLRAVAVSQGIDTASKAWRIQSAMYATMDEELATAIGDHVREGLTGLHLRGWVTGAVPVGYRAEEVPGERPTRRNLPRRRLAIDPEAAPHVRRAFDRVAAGMPLAKALREYLAEGGAADPRGGGRMTPQAFRRLLARTAYIGVFVFGRRRNSFSSTKDGIVQQAQDEKEHRVFVDESLRVVDEELFLRVQARLAKLRPGPRGPREPGRIRGLADLVVGVFRCPHCDRRYHTCGAAGDKIACPNGDDCPARCVLDRGEAVAAICRVLARRLERDRGLVRTVVAEAQARSAAGDADAGAELERVRGLLKKATARLSKMLALAGDAAGAEEERLVDEQLRAARAERADLELRANRLEAQLRGSVRALTPEQVEAALARLAEVLDAGAAGKLDARAQDEAAELFRRLVGGRVEVFAEVRAGRDRTVVRGVFKPRLLEAVAVDALPRPEGAAAGDAEKVSVWLRPPPRLDALAGLVAWLYERHGLGFRRITTVLTQAGVKVGCGNVYACHLRHYELLGLPVPPRRPRGRQKAG